MWSSSSETLPTMANKEPTSEQIPDVGKDPGTQEMLAKAKVGTLSGLVRARKKGIGRLARGASGTAHRAAPTASPPQSPHCRTHPCPRKISPTSRSSRRCRWRPICSPAGRRSRERVRCLRRHSDTVWLRAPVTAAPPPRLLAGQPGLLERVKQAASVRGAAAPHILVPSRRKRRAWEGRRLQAACSQTCCTRVQGVVDTLKPATRDHTAPRD